MSKSSHNHPALLMWCSRKLYNRKLFGLALSSDIIVGLSPCMLTLRCDRIWHYRLSIKRNIPSLRRLKQASLILLRCALCINGGVEYFVNYLGNGSHERGNYIMFPQKYFLKFNVWTRFHSIAYTLLRSFAYLKMR